MVLRFLILLRMFGLSLLVFRDRLVGGLMATSSKEQGIPVATFAVEVVFGVLNRGEIAVGDAGLVSAMVAHRSIMVSVLP